MYTMFYIFVVVGLIAFFIGYALRKATPEAMRESESALSSLSIYTWRPEGDREVITLDGVDYFSWEGEFDEGMGNVVWDWHGRMGKGLGLLLREGSVLPDGELYTLRDRSDILLAHMPNDGWPLTDMKIFLPEGVTLPEIRPDGFSYGEVFRLEGAFQEESYERVCNLTDPGILNRLGELWLTGESFDPPEGEYELYRIRLYSSEIPGLYVSLNLNVCAYLQSYALEKYRFTGDTLLSVDDAKQIFGDLF